MIKLLYKNNDFLVYDNVLEETDIVKLREYVLNKEHRYAVFKGGRILLSVGEIYSNEYPSNTHVDIFVKQMLHLMPLCHEYIDKCTRFFIKSAITAQGSGLAWHQDPINPGYVFYCHEKWNKEWAGELLINDNPEENIGQYIYPKPNRLVVFKPNILHALRRVEQCAENLRLTVLGGFLND